MENRLSWQSLLPILMIVACSSFSTFLSGQDFTLNYTGADTLYVGNDCTASLDWGHPNTINFTASSGNLIDTFYVTAISGGFAIGDQIRAPRSVTISYFVEDTAGVNQIFQSALRIVIADSTQPVFDLATLPRDTAYDDLNDVPQPPSISTVDATDNCGIETIRYNGESTRPIACGSFTRTWEAIDTAGNSTLHIQTIAIANDTDAPVWTTNPTPLIISCDTANNVETEINNWLAANGNGTATDQFAITYDHNYLGLVGCGVTGDVVVNFTATDACGNVSSANGTLSVTDDKAPVIAPLAMDTAVAAINPALSLADWLALRGNAMATDFCTTIDNSDTSAHWTIVSIDTTMTCGNNVDYAVLFSVMDDCGNADSTMATYSIIDTLGPDINGLIADTTDVCGGADDGVKLEQWFIAIRDSDLRDAHGNALDFVEINYTDRDGFAGTWSGVGVPLDASFIPDHDCQWYIDAEAVFRDDCGNLGLDTARYFLIDTIQPTITNLPNDTVVNCGQIPIASTDVVTMDNCDTSLTVTIMDNSDTTLSAIIITRTYSATDDCGNIATSNQIITVIDTIAPVLAAIPLDTMVTCGNIPMAPFIMIATDNCTDSAALTYDYFETSNQLNHADSCQTYNYTIQRTWVAIDAFNNADSSTQIIIVVDTVAPTFTLPADITVSCELRDDLMITGQPTNLIDNCDTLPDFSYVDLVIGGDCVGGGALDTIFRTWTVMDACGNSTDGRQRIILIDTLAPLITGLVSDITVQCNGDGVPLPAIGTDITATDNCSNSPIIQYLGETNTQNADPAACDFYNYTIIRTWRATDACGNAAEFTQNINIVDTLAPTIICPADFIVESNANDCGGAVELPKPFYFDGCTGTSSSDSLFLTQNFTNAPGGDINATPVDTLTFNFNIGNTAPEKTIISDLLLTINLNSVDGEGANEIFSIIGEDGTVFAGTNPTQVQCGNSTTTITISAAQANSYAVDSIITIILAPNGVGTDAINNICTDGNANLTLTYDFEAPATSISLSYRIDGGAVTDLETNPTATFNSGANTITYFATDCSGNQDSCSFVLTVTDKTPPTFDCPNAIITYTDSNSCTAEVLLPFPTNFVDNCGAFDTYDQTMANFITFENDANAGRVPTIVTNTFPINSPNAIGDGTISVSFLGDNKDAGEFFNVYGENGVLLGTTMLGDSISECSNTVMTTFTLSQDTINAWAADGNITITAEPNLDAVNFSDFINPCDTNLNTNLTDGNSVLSIGLNFPTILVNYTIADTNDVVLSTGMLRSPNIPVVGQFDLGINRVTYRISDAVDNEAACLFTVEVKDTLAPIVVCNNDFVVLTNPSGDTTDLTLLVDSLITTIGDNCGIADISISPNKLSCADVGMTTIMVTVTDSSGNTATCQSAITIDIETLEPTFSVGVCNNDALFLFADTTFQTATLNDANFTYNWTGPNNFTSTEANPMIQNVGSDNSGTYTLTMTGESGCTSTGTLFVNISSVDAPILNTLSATVCKIDGITLTTSAANCTDLEYQWYEIVERADTLGGDTIMLVGTSTIPSFTIAEPSAGTHSYYLIVKCDDCSSLGSEIVAVTVFDVPAAVTGTPSINICEGESIALSSPLTDQTCTYSWVGPGFTSNLPTPAPIENATEANEGVYTLTVSKNGCISEEAFTVVNITSSPAKPNIANESGTIICEGSSLVLKTDILNGNTYTWMNATTLATFTTTTPELSIDTSKVTDAGLWTVSVELSNCTSEPSDEVMVQVEAKPAGTPFFEGAACEGRTIRLNVSPIIAGASYEWTDAAGTAFFGTNPEVPVQTAYTLSITSVNGCVTKKVLPIDVKITPVITTLFDSGDADPCIVPDDTDVRLIADVFPANDGTYTFTWTTPDGTQMAPIPDSMLMIPNTSATNVNGTYTLVINTGNGCQSDPVSNIIEVVDIPIPNPVITTNTTSLCEGERLILNATEYPNISAEYRWQITSIMDTITQSPVLILDSVTTALSGVVTLEVYNGTCPSASTATLPISVNSPLAQPAVNAVGTFCAGEVISLTTTAVQGATYLWEGPNFMATSTTPDIVVTANASPENNGGYTVQILANGCTSPKADPLIVFVNEVPVAPIANNSGDICLANASDIILFIDTEDTPSDAVFRWYNATNNQLVAGPNTSKSQIIEVGNLPEGTYQFFATQTLNGCESKASNITELMIAEIPTELAQVCNGNMTICDANQAVICAQPPDQGIGTWSIEDASVIIDNPNEPETSVSGLIPGSTYTFFWTLSNGVCGAYSATRLIVDVGVTGSIAKVCSPLLEVCEGNTVNLCANPVPTGFDGKWSQPSSQAALGVTIDDSAASNTTVSTIEPGNPYNAYTFYWTVIDDAGVCTASDTMTVKVYSIPNELAIIEDTELISCNGAAVVTANPLKDNLTGQWSSQNATIIFDNPSNPSTSLSNLDPGMNTLVWSLTSGACGAYASDEITVFYEQAPTAVDDVYDIGFSSAATLNVTENDEIFSPEYDITILSAPMNGTVEVDDDGNISFEANQNFVGSDIFTYELCNPTCASDCSIAQVELKIGEDASCIVPTIMTPNGDGVNDVFMIPCIETGNFPGNEVIIFNQWGDEIYRSAPYRNDWRGTYNGEDIPAGTYYYVIGFDRNTEPKAGFLIIER